MGYIYALSIQLQYKSHKIHINDIEYDFQLTIKYRCSIEITQQKKERASESELYVYYEYE